jgi:hypothetical protein
MSITGEFLRAPSVAHPQQLADERVCPNLSSLLACEDEVLAGGISIVSTRLLHERVTGWPAPPPKFQFCWLTGGRLERLTDMPRAYPPEFRARAIALVRAGKQAKQRPRPSWASIR